MFRGLGVIHHGGISIMLQKVTHHSLMFPSRPNRFIYYTFNNKFHVFASSILSMFNRSSSGGGGPT
jgi:hypothetical protein